MKTEVMTIEERIEQSVNVFRFWRNQARELRRSSKNPKHKHVREAFKSARFWIREAKRLKKLKLARESHERSD